jgi:hypothetical protein
MFTPPRSYLPALLFAALVCVVAILVGDMRFGSPLYLYSDVKGKPGTLQGTMTAVSGFLLVASAIFFAMAGATLRQRGQRGLPLVCLAGLLVLLAFDEVVMLHEWAAHKLDSIGTPRLFGIDQDIYVFFAYGVISLACLLPMLDLLRHERAIRPLGNLALLFAACSETMDFVPWDSLTVTQQHILGPLEEAAKTMATFCAALYAHALMQRQLHPGPHLQATAPDRAEAA